MPVASESSGEFWGHNTKLLEEFRRRGILGTQYPILRELGVFPELGCGIPQGNEFPGPDKPGILVADNAANRRHRYVAGRNL
ncbi:MAG: hypothetical protein HW380_1408 [Magnetococcales bacterium]|nr:hypothetical protein [Magnetococcales bacterium]